MNIISFMENTYVIYLAAFILCCFTTHVIVKSRHSRFIYTVENTTLKNICIFVYVNGTRVRRAYYADVKKGVVKYYTATFVIKKLGNDRFVAESTVTGDVVVAIVTDDRFGANKREMRNVTVED